MPHSDTSIPGLWATRDFDAVMPPVAVLIVDDDAAMAEALAAALMVYGCRVLVAPGGWAALAIPESWTPDAVVLDIEMPDIDGFGVAKAMRGSTRCNGAHPRAQLACRSGNRGAWHRSRN